MTRIPIAHTDLLGGSCGDELCTSEHPISIDTSAWRADEDDLVLLWETMVFGLPELDDVTYRWPSEKGAREGHGAVVQLVRAKLLGTAAPAH